MLMLTLSPEDYVTINGDIVIQVSEFSKNRVRLSIDADRSVPIVRGKVLERGGERRPACLGEARAARRPGWDKIAYRWSDRKEQAARSMEAAIARLEQSGAAEDAALLRRELESILPPVRPDGAAGE